MNISKTALEALRNELAKDDRLAKTVRFFAVQGCCGVNVQMAVEDAVPATDEVFMQENLQFSIAPEVKDLLSNVTLEAVDGGFVLEGYNSSCC